MNSAKILPPFATVSTGNSKTGLRSTVPSFTAFTVTYERFTYDQVSQ